MEGKVAAGMLLESFNEKPVATIAELAEHCTAAPGQAFNKIGMQSGRTVFLSNKELIDEQNRITEEYGHYKVGVIKAKVCECKHCRSGQGHPNHTAPIGARARPGVTVEEQFGVGRALDKYASLYSRPEAPRKQGRRRRAERASAPRYSDAPICASFDEVDIEELRRVLPHDTLVEMGIAIAI